MKQNRGPQGSVFLEYGASPLKQNGNLLHVRVPNHDGALVIVMLN
jgi:hypothetical protein